MLILRALLRFVAGVAIVASLGLVVQIVIWAKDRGPATYIFGRDILTPLVAPGSEYVHINDFIRLKFCATVVERWFVDKNGKRHDVATLYNALATTGGLNVRQETEARILVPADMPEGLAFVAFQPRWRCNPLHEVWPIYGPLERIPFSVDKEAPPPPPPRKKV